MSTVDLINQDDTAYLLRTLIRKVDSIERKIIELSPPGAVMAWPAWARSSEWSFDRDEALGNDWTRRYKFNEINEAQYFDSIDGDIDNRIQIEDVANKAEQGHPGLLPSEGSYSVHFHGVNVEAPFVDLGARGWYADVIFRPEDIPASSSLFWNGTGSGYGLYIGGASAYSSGSNLCFAQQTGEWYDTGYTLTEGKFYNVILKSDTGDNKLYWSVGKLCHLNRDFTIEHGNFSHAASSTPTGELYIGNSFDGRIDEVCFGTSEPNQATREDRIRATLEPAPPTGWLLADGAEVSRHRFAKLFAATGSANGSGDGSTTFNLPNYPGSIVKF